MLFFVPSIYTIGICDIATMPVLTGSSNGLLFKNEAYTRMAAYSPSMSAWPKLNPASSRCRKKPPICGSVADHARTCGGSFETEPKVRVEACRRRFVWETYVCDSSDMKPSGRPPCPEEEAGPATCGDNSFSFDGAGSCEPRGYCSPRRRPLPRRVERRICPCLHSAAEEKRARTRGSVESANTVTRVARKMLMCKTRLKASTAILGSSRVLEMGKYRC